MSKYTTEVRYICETSVGLQESLGYASVNDTLEQCWDKIFDFDFPIFDENYRRTLCIKILKHFYTREIGEETVGLWKLRLDAKMNEIMPHYNKLYEAWAEDFNLLDDTNITRQHILDRTGNTQGTTETEAKNRYSDTPQGSLQNVENDTYLTNASRDTGETSYNQDMTSKDEYTELLKGKSAGKSFSEMLDDYNSVNHVDVLIITDLEPLFMQIW